MRQYPRLIIDNTKSPPSEKVHPLTLVWGFWLFWFLAWMGDGR